MRGIILGGTIRGEKVPAVGGGGLGGGVEVLQHSVLDVCAWLCLAKRPEQCAPHIINIHVSPPITLSLSPRFPPLPCPSPSPTPPPLHDYGRSHRRRCRHHPTSVSFRSCSPSFNRKRHFIVLYAHIYAQKHTYTHAHNIHSTYLAVQPRNDDVSPPC